MYQVIICMQRNFVSRDHRVVYLLAGLISSFSIFIEKKGRRSGTHHLITIAACVVSCRAFCACRAAYRVCSLRLVTAELALYTLPRAVDSIYMQLLGTTATQHDT